MKRLLFTLLATFGLCLPTLRAQEETTTPANWADAAETSWYGEGTASSYTISTAAELAGLAKLVNGGNDFEGKTITLTENVDLSGKAWTPIGDKENKKYFRGTFIGQGEGAQVLISNLSIDVPPEEKDYQALFGAINGATIKNIRVEGSVKAKNAAGIVARMDGGTIENCTNAAEIDGGTSKSGGIVCLTNANVSKGEASIIINCHNEGSVKGGNDGCGGIIGYSNEATITCCTNTGVIVATSEDTSDKKPYAGGIVGYVSKTKDYSSGVTTIIECTNTGTISAKGNEKKVKGTAGGIVAIAADGCVACTITNCTNEGEVTSQAEAGGIIGSMFKTTVVNCKNTKAITGGTVAGGVVGRMGTYAILENCSGGVELIKVSSRNAYAGRLIGNVETSAVVQDVAAHVIIDDANGDNYDSLPTVGGFSDSSSWGVLSVDKGTLHGFSGAVNNQGVIYFAPGTAWENGGSVNANVAGKWGCSSTAPDWEHAEKMVIAKVGDTQCYTLSEIAKAKKESPEANVELSVDTFPIADLANFKAFRDLVDLGVTFDGTTVTLMADIDLGNEEWEPIGKKEHAFQGAFDGNGKTISNLTITGTSDCVGLFGYITTPAVIKNLTVQGANVSGVAYVGVLVGNAHTGTVENCHVTGTIAIKGNYCVGGLAGSGYADIYMCSVRGTAEQPATITATYSDLRTNLEGDNVGGLVGFRGEGKGIETVGCEVANVKVEGTRKVGGLIGSAFQDNVIEKCSVAGITVVCNATTDYATKNQKSLGLGGLVGLYTANGSDDGTLLECTVSDVTFKVSADITCSMGVVTGGLRGSSTPTPPAKSMTVANITISGTNTTDNGALNNFLTDTEDVPGIVYPTEKFSYATAFISSFTGNATVYDGEAYYATMQEACKAIHSKETMPEGGFTLWCKPGATIDMKQSHVHVCRTLTVYGNGATVTGGEHDFELDTYKDKVNTQYDADCEGIQEDISLTIHALNAVAVWGGRNTTHTLNITLEDCKNINRVYLVGTTGTNNITLKNCTASGSVANANEKANSCTVYSNAAGTITVEGCVFTAVPEPINLNNKSTKEQKVSVKHCVFTDCATTKTAESANDITWAAPIRALTTTEGGSTELTVDACVFSYAEDVTKCNGDILLGEGRAKDGENDRVSYPTVTATITNTAAEVQVQQPGDRTATASSPTKVVKVEASETKTIKNTLPAAKVEDEYCDTLADVTKVIEAKMEEGATKLKVTLLKDNTNFSSLSIPEGLALMLDLNGKTYTYWALGSTGGRYAIYLGETSTLTVEDSSVEQKGTVKATGTATCCLNNNGGTLNVRGGRFVADSSKTSYAIVSAGACTLDPADGQSIELTGGLKVRTGTVRIAGDTTINGEGQYYAIYVGEQTSESESASIEIEGGTFIHGSEGKSAICVDLNYGVKSKATFHISGGTFEGNFSGNGVGTYELSGGTYSVDPTTTVAPSKVTLKQGYFSVENAQSSYDVGPFAVAITNGDAKGGYATLQDAVEAAKNGETITLLRDVTLEDTVKLEGDVKIDLAGHTLYARDSGTLAFSSENEEGVKVTFSDSSKTEAKNGTGAFVSKKQAEENNGSYVTIEGVEITAVTRWTDKGAYDASWYEKDFLEGKREITLTTAAQVAGIAGKIREIERKNALDIYNEVDDPEPLYYFEGVAFTLKVAGDLDFSALEWEAKRFDGKLLGNGHTIKGIRVSGEKKGEQGFFSELRGSIECARFVEADVTAKPFNNGANNVCYGGVVAGKLSGGTISNCVVEDCKVTATASATREGIGAFAGTGTGKVENCLVSGVTLEGDATKGTFVGNATGCTIANGYVDGELTQNTGTLENVYAKNAEGHFVRYNTEAAEVETILGDGAQLNGIGWLLNGQKTEGEPVWRVDSNEACTTLQPFGSSEVAQIPDVARRLTESASNAWLTFPGEYTAWHGYFANGYTATVKLNADGKTVLTTRREDYLVDEELELKTYDNSDEIYSSVVVFGGSNGGTLTKTDLTVELTKGTLPRVFGGSYSAPGQNGTAAVPSVIEGTAKLTLKGGTVNKAYGGSCGDASVVAAANLMFSGGTVKTAVVATSNGGNITGTATLTVNSDVSTAAKLVAMERGSVKDVTFTLRGVTTGGICLTAESATAEVSVTGIVKLDNRVANQGTVYLGAAMAKVAKVTLSTLSSYPITVLAQTALKATKETVTIPAGCTVTVNSNVTLQVPENVTLDVYGTVSASNNRLVGTKGTSMLNISGSVTGLEQGLSAWDVATSKWVQALIKASNGAYYGTVEQALAALGVGDKVTLLSESVATGNVIARSAGREFTAGAAYDVADVLGGAFVVTKEDNTPRLVYAYDLGVGGLTIRKAVEGEVKGTDELVVEVTVKLAEGGVAPSRTLEGCTLTVTSIVDENEETKKTFTLKEGLTFTEGVCKVVIPYTTEGEEANFPMGTSRLTVSISKGEATPPAEEGEPTL